MRSACLLTCGLCGISTDQVVTVFSENVGHPFLAFVCGICAQENGRDERLMRERIRQVRCHPEAEAFATTREAVDRTKRKLLVLGRTKPIQGLQELEEAIKKH